MSRVGGKRAFLRWHQTYTHAFPVIAALTVLSFGLLWMWDIRDPRVAGALGLGMCFHSVLDYSNTYGITLLAPFSPRRFCGEWVFFIDLPVIVVSVVALAFAWGAIAQKTMPGATLAWTYGGFLLGYWALRTVLRRRAARFAPEGTRSLLPTAFLVVTGLSDP